MGLSLLNTFLPWLAFLVTTAMAVSIVQPESNPIVLTTSPLVHSINVTAGRKLTQHRQRRAEYYYDTGKGGKGGKDGKRGKRYSYDAYNNKAATFAYYFNGGGKGKGKGSPFISQVQPKKQVEYQREKKIDCTRFDFLSRYRVEPQVHKERGWSGKGKGKGGRRSVTELKNYLTDSFTGQDSHRQLQFEGEDCSPNVLAAVKETPELSIFNELLQLVGLQDIFGCSGPFTVMAPSNDAFLENPSLLQYLRDPANRAQLEKFLLQHILEGFYMTTDFSVGGRQYKTLLGGTVTVSSQPLKVDHASITWTDLTGCNGVVDVIDDVLIAPGRLNDTWRCLFFSLSQFLTYCFSCCRQRLYLNHLWKV